MQICSWKYSAHTQKSRNNEKKGFLKRTLHLQSYKLNVQNQGAICKNVACLRESLAESIDHTPIKRSPVKRRRFQTFKKASHEKWPFVTVDEKGDTCENSEVHSIVVK